MYHVGEMVVYGMHGICNVVDTERKYIDGKERVYLVLEPIGQEGSRYLIPTHSPAAMAKLHAVMTEEELMAMFASQAVREDVWISEEGQRKQYFRELITGGDRLRITQMVCSLYRQRRKLSASGKKSHICDDNFLRDAEKLLCSEIAVILNISINEAKALLRSKLKEDA